MIIQVESRSGIQRNDVTRKIDYLFCNRDKIIGVMGKRKQEIVNETYCRKHLISLAKDKSMNRPTRPGTDSYYSLYSANISGV